MEEHIDLTGRWTGYYVQHDTARGIVADLVQEGCNLSGTMRDGETEFEQSMFDAAFHAGLPPGADERIERELRERYPNAKGKQIRCVSKLSADSVLEGKIDGRRVEFTKTYQGEHFTGYRIGEELVGETTAGHGVHYEGEILEGDNEIEGTWSIPGPTGQGDEDGFLLRREPRASGTRTEAAE